MFEKILIANRGEIACRVMATARRMGIATVAVYSDADREAMHVRMADEAVRIGPPPANRSYLLEDEIIAACEATGAEAVHPGYGFLSERASFCARLEASGVVFIGPKPRAIEAMGDKITSKKIAAEAGVSTVPGFMGLIDGADHAVKIAREIGYPVMIKASAGGGGKGMRVAYSDAEAREGFDLSKNEAASAFGDDRIFIEKFVEEPRHIEIQVLADAHGNAIYLNERECSIQRRNQKVIEEAPSAFLDAATRQAMGAQSVALARAVDYQSAGTVEFIVDRDRNFYFLEMNTRLQVEHPVTELITGVDLVEEMIRIAAGERLRLSQSDIGIHGWAIESRIYAEDPYRNFMPSTGRLVRYVAPAEGPTASGATIRNDTGVAEGAEISMFYDPMISKLCAWAPTREHATDAMADALDAFVLEGIGHNIPLLAAIYQHPRWRSGDISTRFIAEEYPDGFSGASADAATLRRLAAVAALVERASIRRPVGAATVGGLLNLAGAEGERVVVLGTGTHAVVLASDRDGTRVTVDGEDLGRVDFAYTRGALHAFARFGEAGSVVRVDTVAGGWRLRLRGLDLVARVHSPHVAELAAMMPEKIPADTSNLLLCPMPGVVVSLAVAEGDAVQEGQALAVVEAMKMQNVLRAQKAAQVKRIPVKVGESLALDALIMEFES
ncbi:acetyl/propionyl/methylcrotonyl-CoA carboxylase subunit alpha [Acuticoccus sp. I52.16.1]|uniref:acetyl-CoA carboxylase biotin carboxylase subunit n=1 Tax=Acuticoccus sp. I52.16.1 TaxID=2928472 RepID=UPI001FD133AA|nr:acetyl/propionyl/methylcrotonyl-CoA carboxylase subunit alpha [Acuticoccus sp. I52.16.1]UOM36555.1 acetyl/propionyl/methylcrotonyl-CoA carboxylase subunit alpha [Acuticoccus sp. I52.16.1]